jgi:DUF4097 and DUF4098 domain-containing protein YvlB
VRHQVQVPSAFHVVIDGSDGDVTASGLTGPLTVDRSDGDITVVDLTGPLDLRSRTGEIRGEALRGEVLLVESVNGDVQLELLVPPRSVEVTARDGEVDVAVPADTTYRVEADTRSGEERVLVPLDPASTRTLRLHGVSGDVTVRPTR